MVSAGPRPDRSVVGYAIVLNNAAGSNPADRRARDAIRTRIMASEISVIYRTLITWPPPPANPGRTT